MNHLAIGVYVNGDYKINIVRPADLEEHIEFNKQFRFGRALFVDGECVHSGELNKSQVQEWSELIGRMKINTSVASNFYV